MRIRDLSSDVCSSDLTLCIGEPVERAQQIAEGVSELAIGIGRAGQHFLADPHIVEIVGRRHPHAKNVGPAFAHHLQRTDDVAQRLGHFAAMPVQRKAVRSEEHTSELQSLMRTSYAVFCLKKKKKYTK